VPRGRMSAAVKCRLFNVLAGMSLVLCMASLILWVRIYRLVDYATVGNTSGLGAGFVVLEGRGAIFFFRHRPQDDEIGLHWKVYRRRQVALTPARYVGFDIRCENDSVGKYFAVSAPLPVAAIALLVAPSLVLWRMLRRVGPTEARCRVCGYDLRATPDRCPECGTAVEPAA
jgi:hypothetical protein